jgi:hypothetical protein
LLQVFGGGTLAPVCRRSSVVTALAAASVVAAGCGGQNVADHQREVAADPYALTCADLARQPESSTNQRLVIHAEFALAQEPIMKDRVDEMTLNRAGRSIYWALTEICKDRDASYKPALDAVDAVRRGRYLVQPRPESWSHPERWWDDSVKPPGD